VHGLPAHAATGHPWRALRLPRVRSVRTYASHPPAIRRLGRSHALTTRSHALATQVHATPHGLRHARYGPPRPPVRACKQENAATVPMRRPYDPGRYDGQRGVVRRPGRRPAWWCRAGRRLGCRSPGLTTYRVVVPGWAMSVVVRGLGWRMPWGGDGCPGRTMRRATLPARRTMSEAMSGVEPNEARGGDACRVVPRQWRQLRGRQWRTVAHLHRRRPRAPRPPVVREETCTAAPAYSGRASRACGAERGPWCGPRVPMAYADAAPFGIAVANARTRRAGDTCRVTTRAGKAARTTHTGDSGTQARRGGDTPWAVTGCGTGTHAHAVGRMPGRPAVAYVRRRLRMRHAGGTRSERGMRTRRGGGVSAAVAVRGRSHVREQGARYAGGPCARAAVP
jgi:hypothetical protein